MAVKSQTPQDCCDKILTEIRTSNLHFMVQESPYSVYLTLRKKFTQSVPQVLKSMITSDENNSLKTKLTEALRELAEAKDNIEVLESKLVSSETELFRESNSFEMQREKLRDENKLLKESISKSHSEESKQNRAFNDVSKTIKVKEKEIYNLQNRLENFSDTNKKLKENLSELKKEKKKTEKALATLEKKEGAVQVKLEAKIKDLEQKLIAKDTKKTTAKSVYIPPATSSSRLGLSTCNTVTSAMGMTRFHSNPSTSPDSSVLPSQESNLKTSPIPASNWISYSFSQTIPVSNSFQVLDPDSGTADGSAVPVDEDNNHRIDALEKVKVEVEKEDNDRKPNFMAPEQEKAFLNQFRKLLEGKGSTP
jgi:myosin heavy subunit